MLNSMLIKHIFEYFVPATVLVLEDTVLRKTFEITDPIEHPMRFHFLFFFQLIGYAAFLIKWSIYRDLRVI